MRRELDKMGRLIIKRKFEGTTLQGCSHMRWIDQITKRTGKRMHSLTKQVIESDNWKEMFNEFQRQLRSHKGKILMRRG
jgi:hypothetical protein